MKVKAFELRNKTSRELLKEVEEFKSELSQLRVAKATGAAPSKLAKIRVIRKNIARCLTVYNQKQRQEVREQFKGKKYVPQDLRPKATRAIRRALTKAQKNAVTQRVKTRTQNFPKRRFAISA
jgi:large subunit ribosomal protein L35e